MNELIMLLAAGAGAYYLLKQTPAAAEAGTMTSTPVSSPTTSTDPVVQAAVAAAQAAGITPTDVHQTVTQTQTIAPGATTPTAQTVTITQVNTNPSDPTQGLYVVSPADQKRMYGFYVPNPPPPTQGVKDQMMYSGQDLTHVLADMANGNRWDSIGDYKMTAQDWNYYRQLWGSGATLLTEPAAGPAWGHLMNQEYITAIQDPVNFAANYRGYVWA